ncbi:hypothetical protein IB229_11850 [Pseudomonas sp. PDM14]|uniref:hypothetical protein n=1 Tax=Pseudomonas sp. PDM14 TaxID=2769288 RepID=UPI00178279AB|nr:hypothetical protein [Pseudomonas sp. PDM14]MBD9483670.1 hypothetical protein [Pseudomonas sp. PDM14]
MNDYRIQLLRDERLLAEMTVAAARFIELHEELLQRFPAAEGFSLHIQIRRERRRVVEQGPQGLRLLGIEYEYEECQ